MELSKISIVFLVNGLWMAMSQGSPVDRIMELDGHRSVIYLSLKNESKGGVAYMFERINAKIAAYGLFHCENTQAAEFVKDMWMEAIFLEAGQYGARANTDWKSFLKIQLKNIEKMVKESHLMFEANTVVSVTFIIVDGKTATTAESLPFEPTKFKKITSKILKLGGLISDNETGSVRKLVTVIEPRYRFVVTGAGFELNAEIDAITRLERIRDWKNAAVTVAGMGNVPRDYVGNAKGVIVVDLDPPK